MTWTTLARARAYGVHVLTASGIVAAFLGVKAEGESLENIAKPLTAEEDSSAGGGPRTSPQPA